MELLVFYLLRNRQKHLNSITFVYMVMIKKNNIIKVNRLFGETLSQSSNLDFEIDMANRQKNIYKKLAHIARAMTAGHSFSNANKRTALVVIQSEMAKAGLKCDKIKLTKLLVRLSKTQETRIPIIERRLRK